MENIGEKIKSIRSKKGYSQDYMANMLDISQSTYAKYESEATDITLKRLKEIANVLEYDFVNFFSGDKKAIYIHDNKDSSNNQYIENQNNDVKEMSEKLIKVLESENAHLKDEVEFLKKIISKNNIN